ncbi:MerR family transcriptional regulator (plasmid) [Sphingomonas sp. AAP5]|uniref:MerR family transcriptional regulator n=1 Tax=Sphingomonas sp. AAP5 TaxID=1523415 RepID=UPI001056E2E2|nr:helix-turn-helix domain-containing protein [Sphingomonas sp. AAP5]QBM78215.1 MerR family transcriptional regulator [Sphingomonas sp. AAP5]
MIGDLAKRTGTKVNTIRFYEDIGLMPEAVRTSGGRRIYGEPQVRQLAFIRHARELGFSVDEIRSLIALSANPDQDCNEAGAIARRHLASVEDRIMRLVSLRDALRIATRSCDGGRIADCRVMEAITTLPGQVTNSG